MLTPDGRIMSKIVVVDEVIETRHLYHKILTEAGHEVITLPTGDSVLSLLNHDSVDVLLLDIQVNGKSNFSVLAKIRNAVPRLPVVVFSQEMNSDLEKMAYEAGAIQVLPKDLPIEDLCEKVNSIIDAKKKIFNKLPPNRKFKILIVDDEDQIRSLLSNFFDQKGFQTLMASSGEEAVEIAVKERPNLVLLDVILPGMDGVLTLQKLLENDSNLGVIMISGLQDEKLVQEAMSLGAFHYLSKPFDMKNLEKVVRRRFSFN